MKTIKLTFIKFILPLGLGLVLWQGGRLANSIGPLGPQGSKGATINSNLNNRSEASEFHITWKKGVDTAAAFVDSPEYDSQTSTSPKDRVPSMVTLGWGVSLTEAR